MFSDDNFKGEAHQTAALVPLVRYYMETLIEPASRVPPACVESFRCLCNIVSFIREISHGLYPLDEASMQHFAALQQKHQTLFAAAYGEQHKPKHHHRMHIPTQWLAAGVPVNCEPGIIHFVNGVIITYKWYNSGQNCNNGAQALECVFATSEDTVVLVISVIVIAGYSDLHKDEQSPTKILVNHIESMSFLGG